MGRHTRPFLPALVVALLFLQQPGTLRADFCEDLDLVVASAGEGFRQVRGELVTGHVDPLSDTRVLWECGSGLPGVDRCHVEWQRQTFTYGVQWLGPNLEALEQEFEAVKELLAACGATEKQPSSSGKSIWYVIEGHEDLDIVLAYNSNRVRLSVSAIGYFNPGLQ